MGKIISVDGLISCVVFSKVIVICPLAFVYLRSQCVNYSKNPNDTVWDNQEREV